MNPHEVAADLDDKSIKILHLLLREGRFLNEGVPVTLSTPTVKSEQGWTNQTILRRFRKLRDADLVTLSEIPDYQAEHDRYPRPPKQITLRANASDVHEVINNWGGREARSPARLTDDLDDIDHRIDATDNRLTNRIDALQSKQYAHLRQHALADRERARRRDRALIVAVGAAIAYLIVVVAIVFTAPDLLASVLIGGVGGVFGVAAGTGVAAYARSDS